MCVYVYERFFRPCYEVIRGLCVLEDRMNEPDSHDAHKGWEMVLFSRRMGIRAFRYTTEIQWKGTSHHLMRHSGRPWGNRAPWLYDKCVRAAVILEWRTSPAVLHSSSLKMAFLKSTTSLLLRFTLWSHFEVCSV